MSIPDFPAITPNANQWGSEPNGQSTRSELDGTKQTLALPGDIWTDVLTFTNKFDPEARILRAFITALRGEAGRFYLSPPGYVRAGTGTGTPLVKGADQAGLTIITDGWTINQTGVVCAGDYIQIGTELKMVTADANSDGTGQATISFTPPIRTIPADNSAIVVDSPKAIMKLKDNQQGKFSMQPGHIYAASIAIEEALQISTGTQDPLTRVTKETSFLAVSGKAYYCDTTSVPIDVILPHPPVINDFVIISTGPDASTNNITVARNGETIMGLAEDMTISINNITVELIYDGSTWRIA